MNSSREDIPLSNYFANFRFVHRQLFTRSYDAWSLPVRNYTWTVIRIVVPDRPVDNSFFGKCTDENAYDQHLTPAALP